MLKSKTAPLTSARFAAAFYVILFHTAYASGLHMPPWLKTFISLGGASVSFFFVSVVSFWQRYISRAATL